MKWPNEQRMNILQMCDFFKLVDGLTDYVENQKYKVLFGNAPTEENPNPKKTKYTAILLFKGEYR